MAEGVRPDEDVVRGVDHAAFDHAAHHCAHERDGEGVVDVEFERTFCIVVAVVWQDVQERPHQVKALACDVGDLENGTYPLADELSGGLDGLFAVLDEDGDFTGAGRFENAGQLGDGLLQDLRRADVDFSDDHHDWDVESQSNAEMFSGRFGVSLKQMQRDILAEAQR